MQTPTDGKSYKWLVMVYLSGDNNLSPEMIWALHEMAEVNLPEDVAITIQYDPRSPSFRPARYALTSHRRATLQKEYEAEAEKLSSQVEEDVYQIPIAWAKDHEWGRRPLDDTTDPRRSLNENSAHPRVLANFISSSIRDYRSERRMLVLSGHGSGAIGDFLPDANGRGGQPSALSVPLLFTALEDAKKDVKEDAEKKSIAFDEQRPFIDILGMDSCLMSMVEVGHEVQKHVHYLIGSEGFELTTGWPYGFMLKNWVRLFNPAAPDAACTADNLVESYRAFYRDHGPSGISADIAACDLTHLPALAGKLKELVTLLVRGDAKPLDADELLDLVVIAHWRAQSFKFEQYTDLWDFCAELQRKTAKGEYRAVADACDAVMKCIEGEGGIVLKQKSVGVEYQHAHGLSVFFPWSAPLTGHPNTPPKIELTEYRKLPFALESDWAKFLEYYLVATMRPERRLRKQPVQAEGIEYRQLGEVSEGTPLVRYSPEFNRFSPELNRHLMLMYGGTPPWSMKNPSQRVEVAMQRETARRRSSPTGVATPARV